MFPPEFRLLLIACRLVETDSVVDEACKINKGHRIDWEDLYNRASFHRVEPQLSGLIEKMPASATPDETREQLKDYVQANLVSQIRYVAEFFLVKEWFGNDSITVIPFKGFWLGESAYGNLALRTSSDIDLFISYGALEKVKRIMVGRGYIGHKSLEELTDEYIHGELAEYNFGRYEDGVCQAHIEFHWRSTMSFYRMGISLEDMRSQIITGVIQGRELKVFSPAANLLLVVMHHGGKECYTQLRQVLDIAQIIKRHPDLDCAWLLQQAARFHVSSLLYLGLKLAHELTGVDIPMTLAAGSSRRFIAKLSRGRARLMARPVDELAEYKYTLSSWIFKIRSRDGLMTKAHLLKYTLLKVIAPRLVIERWRSLFFNRKIRKL